MVGLLSLVLTSVVAAAADSPVVYHEGFEEGKPNWSLWAEDASQTCQVNFVGASTEKAFAGKRSLKLDLTFHDGCFCYWGTNVYVPATGDLVLSGYLYVAELCRGHQTGLGWSVSLPPSGHSGCNRISALTEPTRDWRRPIS